MAVIHGWVNVYRQSQNGHVSGRNFVYWCRHQYTKYNTNNANHRYTIFILFTNLCHMPVYAEDAQVGIGICNVNSRIFTHFHVKIQIL